MTRKRPIRNFWNGLSDKVQTIAGVVSALTILGGAALGVINFGISGLNKEIDEHMSTIHAQVENNTNKIDDYITENRVTMARMELMNLMADYPDNKDDVMKAAEQYFCVLKGDYVADQAFENWAREHDVDPSYISNCR